MKASKETSATSKTRSIAVKNGNIVFKLARDGVKDYATYNEALYQVLAKNCLKPFRDNGRLRFKVKRNGRDENFYFYDLAYACYAGKINPATFLDDLQQYYDYKSSSGLSIDHADSNVHNNTALNLSLMSLSLNQSKSEIVSHFTSPFYLNSAYYESKYRVQIICKVGQPYLQNLLIRSGHCLSTLESGFAALHFLCESAEDYVACLKMLAHTSYEWSKESGTPQENWRADRTVRYWAGDIAHSLHAQSVLAMMEANVFQPFPFRSDNSLRE